MVPWMQGYDPLQNQFLSTFAAALPLLVLAFLLGIKRMATHKAVPVSWVFAAAVGILVYKMPAKLVGLSTLLGVLNGLMIMYIIVAAILFYNVLVETKQFDVIKGSLASLSNDRRLQAILIAFAFGTLLEAIAGGGTPVAITAAMLVGMGFDSFYAARLCLLTNTAPVVFGAIGIAVVMLSTVTGLPLQALSAMCGRQTPILSLLIPIILVWIMAGRQGLKGVWPAAIGVGVVFASTQSLVANFIGPYLPDVIGSIVTILFAIGLLRVWRPKEDWRFPKETGSAALSAGAARKYSTGELVNAWYPFLILVAIVGLWGSPGFLKILNHWTVNVPIAGLDKAVLRMPPIVPKASPYPAVFGFNWLSSPGTAVLLTAVLSAVFQPKGLSIVGRQLGKTLHQLRYAIFTGAAVLAFAWVMNYGAMTSTLAIAFALTGRLFPFFSAFLGWLGVFLTGSDTSSNALFGNLQIVTARQVGISEVLAAATNGTGGSLGKMISPISLAVAASATGLVGKEGELFRSVLKYSLILTAVMGIIATLQAYVFKGMIPVP
jgi:lactate permease